MPLAMPTSAAWTDRMLFWSRQLMSQNSSRIKQLEELRAEMGYLTPKNLTELEALYQDQIRYTDLSDYLEQRTERAEAQAA